MARAPKQTDEQHRYSHTEISGYTSYGGAGHDFSELWNSRVEIHVASREQTGVETYEQAGAEAVRK